MSRFILRKSVLFSKFGISRIIVAQRKHFTERYVDRERKLVYGGDLTVSVPRQSVGCLLFNKLKQKEREKDIFQVCSITNHEMTTKSFITRAVALAKRLQQEGIKKGDYVALIGNNSLNMTTCIVGILFLAAVPIPITNKINMEGFNILMNNIRPKYVGCDSAYLFSFKRILADTFDYDVSKIFIINRAVAEEDPGYESFENFIERQKNDDVESFEPTDVQNVEEELAIIMQAISDGACRGAVGLTHFNINNVLARFEAECSVIGQHKVVLMVQKMMWMSGLYSLLLSCYLGLKLIIMKEFSEEYFLKTIDTYKVTTSFLYSSKIWQLYKYNPTREYNLSSCSNLYVVDGSLPESVYKGLKEKFSVTGIPCYGITELSGMALQNYSSSYKTGSAGQLVPLLYGKVMSEKSRRVDALERGEICFKGPTVSNGYLNNPKSNDLFDKEGFFHSGLYGYYDEDGHFFILDRILHVIRYKEHQIAPRQLEFLIKSMPVVKDAVVTGIQHHRDGYYPIAFVVLEKSAKTTSEEIVKYVNDRVPEHSKLRGGVVFLSKIPRSKETGFVNRSIFKKVLGKYKMIREVYIEPESAPTTPSPPPPTPPPPAPVTPSEGNKE